jgi:seryl-tRNA synthetase
VIDKNLLIDKFDWAVEQYARRGVSREEVTKVRDAVLSRRQLERAVDDQRANLKRRSEEIGKLLRQKQTAEAEAAKQQVNVLKEELAASEGRLRTLEEAEAGMLLRVPNLPHKDTPEGLSEADNKVVRVEGYDEARFQGRTWRPHWDVATDLGIFDAERAAKISGAMFSLLKGDGARLLHALVQFGLDINRDRYLEIAPPHFVSTATFTGTGHLPKFEAEAYKLRDDDLWAIPTGEVPMMGLHRDEILAFEELPRRYMAYTVCFRREAGSAGKDTRGMQRLHEFHKVELLELCTPETAEEEHASLLADCERPLKLLGLPYRVVALSCGDLTFSSSRVFDLEVYAPGVQRWLEVSSVGLFTDFQARRGNIRFRRAAGAKPELVHSLNGSGLATPRVWAAVIEHGQQPDGSVRIPEPLVRYFGKDVIRPPAR